jgi:hypothetical protein
VGANCIFRTCEWTRLRGAPRQTTSDPIDPAAPEPDAAPQPDERARARAYLDRWERHLVRVALDGPVRGGRRPPET